MSSKSLLTTFLTLIMSFLFLGAEPRFDKPDFAYPKEVESKAQAMLAKADSGDADGLTRIRAILEICAAQRSIDTDLSFSQPAFIEEQLAKKGLSADDKAMLTAFEASVFMTIYNENQYKYNRVTAPLEPYPADISKWSGEQFRARIISLLESAADKAGNTPLSRYADVLSYSPETLEYLPTVADFVRYRLYDALLGMRYGEIDYRQDADALARKCAAKAKAGSAPFFFWSCKAIKSGTSSDEKGELTALYTKYSDVEAARYVLAQICRGSSGHAVFVAPYGGKDAEASEYASADRLIEMITKSLEAFPGWYDNAMLRNELNELTRPVAELSVPDMVAPDTEFTVDVDYFFAKEVVVSIHSLPASYSDNRASKIARMPKVASEKILAHVKRGSQPLHFKLPKSGHYAAVVTVNGKIEDSRAARFIVTPLKGFALSCSADVYAGVVDFTTGAPLEGVTVSGNDRQSGKLRTSVLGKSDNDGLVRFDAPQSDRYSRRWLSFKKDGKTYDFDGNVYYYNYNKPDTAAIQRSTLILTDRAIYHPGDSINWAVVTASSRRDGKDRHTSADTEITVRLLDANYQEVAKSMMRTDALGRAYGSFATKKEVLTGNYTIRVEITGQRGFASNSVMVSDFKAPVFEVSVTSVKRDMPAKGEITVEGIAKTYSGMPVAGAKVALTLKGASRWRWFSPQATLGTLDATTASDGTFSVKLPADMLGRPLDNGSPYTDFIAEVTVTSATAETAETTRAFTTGKPYTLTATCGQTADSDKPFTLNVAAYDADGNEAAVAFRWCLTDRENVPAQPSGEGVTGTPLTINVADVVSGRYFFEITPVDSSLASEIKTNEFDLYSISRNTLPRYADALFVPVTKAKADASGKVSVLVGANAPELTVFGIVRHGDNILRPTVNTMLKGFTTLEYKLPEGADAAECQLLLVATRDGKTITVAIELESAPVAKTEIVAETFRDRLTPGAGERWRLRLVKGSKGLADAGFIATMYDHALDALTTQSWPSGFGWLGNFSSIVMSTSRLGASYGNTSLQAKMSDEVILEWPSFLFGDITSRAYPRLYGAANGVKIRGSKVLMKAEATMDSSAALEEEALVVEDSEAGAGAGSADDNTAKETYRDPEVLQALWQPSLVADADGNVDIVFTVPNANTTWQFKALGWTKDTDMASFARTALANKPIMVKPNLPRFLRQGDTATVLATVFNNTDETATVETEVAMFDILTGETLGSATFNNEIAAGGSAIVPQGIVAPTDASAVGYRIRSVCGNFADGEQAAIPVLPSSTTVIESTEFYLNPGDSKPFELTVKPSKDETVTLQYCQNPIWTVVKAMRGINTSESITSTGMVSKLFSALAASHIVGTNPDIAEAIKVWSENSDDKALVSMLERNDELKKLLLDQPPWLQNAQSETLRMAALAELLHPDRSRAAIDAAKASLEKMQTADGGFRWGDWSDEPSVWSTRNVLFTLGIARSLGMLPDSFDRMVSKGMAYLQAQATKPHMPETDHELTLIATFFPKAKITAGGRRIIDATVKSVAAGWKKDNTTDKAYDILILAGNGRRAEAAKVLESVRQFGVVKPGTGLCFPNISDIRAYATIIQAYAVMDAPKTDIDAMRQWITVRAQAMDDLGAYNPDYVIASVMLTGSDWTSVPVQQSVTVNGRPLSIDSTESSTGFFSQRIANDGGKTVITVQPNGVTPSYGSVVTVGRRAMTSVKARPGRDISVEKRLLVERDGKWVQTDRLKLGERVRVQLTIKAGRDLEYVSVDDERPASFAPVDQLPGYVWDGSLAFYRENRDASTRLFIGYLPKGTYHISYDMTAAVSGSFVSGIATVQSQYAPELTAHSGGSTVTVAE